MCRLYDETTTKVVQKAIIQCWSGNYRMLLRVNGIRPFLNEVTALQARTCIFILNNASLYYHTKERPLLLNFSLSLSSPTMEQTTDQTLLLFITHFVLTRLHVFWLSAIFV